MGHFQNAQSPTFNHPVMNDYNQCTWISRDDNVLRKLADASTLKAMYNSEQRSTTPMCFYGTRGKVQESIMNWLDDTEGSPIYWLTGQAGTGKSCIAQTIAKTCDDQGRLAASFFFDQTIRRDRRKTINSLTSTLSTQLCKLEWFATHIRRRLQTDMTVLQQAADHQMKSLILEPMAITTTDPSRRKDKVVVIDAIDEAADMKNVEEAEYMVRVLLAISAVAHTLCAGRESGYIPLRFLFTGRKNGRIQQVFERSLENRSTAAARFSLDSDQSKEAAKIDIRKFLEGSYRKWHNEDLPKELNKLVEDSEGLFIYASIVARILKSPGATHNYVERVRGDRSTFARLYKLYSSILSVSYRGDDPESDTCKVVNTVVVLFKALSLRDLGILLASGWDSPRTELALGDLHSIFDIPKEQEKPVRVYHSTLQKFFITYHQPALLEHHATLAHLCLELIMKQLTLGDEANSAFDYACSYWGRHLAEAKPKVWGRPPNSEHPLSVSLTKFAENGVHGLSRWMQLQARKAPDIVNSLHDARSWLKSYGPSQTSQQLCKILLEAERSAFRDMYLE